MAGAADDDSWDVPIREAMEVAYAFGGPKTQTPAIVVRSDPPHGFKGPVMAPAPTGPSALLLWDAIQVLFENSGFFEITPPHVNSPHDHLPSDSVRLRADEDLSARCALAHQPDHYLVDLFLMAADRMLDLVGLPGGPLADATLWHLEVIDADLYPTMHRIVLTAPDIDRLRYTAGQDLMLRVPTGDRVVNRRYTIRSLDRRRAAVTIDVSLHGAGPGTDWIRSARIGDRIDAIGPRGKITLQGEARWHLFIGDETGIPGTLAMMEALPSSSAAIALLEIDTPADEQEPDLHREQRLDVRWLHRLGHSVPGDPSLLLEAVADAALPAGPGHAYVATEAGVVRGIARILIERGFRQDQISAKAYWRRGLPNAEHGEPAREE